MCAVFLIMVMTTNSVDADQIKVFVIADDIYLFASLIALDDYVELKIDFLLAFSFNISSYFSSHFLMLQIVD